VDPELLDILWFRSIHEQGLWKKLVAPGFSSTVLLVPQNFSKAACLKFAVLKKFRRAVIFSCLVNIKAANFGTVKWPN